MSFKKTAIPGTRMLLLLSLILALSPSLFATGAGRSVSSEVTEATVFLSGAEIIRSAEVQLISGAQELVFEGLAEGIDAKSIQVSAPNQVIILSVNHHVNYLKTQTKTKEMTRLEDSLETVNRLLHRNKNESTVLEKEKNMLLANQSLGGKDHGVSVEELSKAADFYRKRLTDIYDRQFDLDYEKQDLTERQARFTRQLNELNYRKNQPSNDIVVKVQTSRPGKYDLKVKFFTVNAGWTPRYDLRAKNVSSPVNLDYRADIRQNTGVDWKNVRLTLSSSNPNLDGTRPTLNPWYVTFQQYRVFTSNRRDELSERERLAKKGEKMGYVGDSVTFGAGGFTYGWDFEDQNTLANFTEVNNLATSFQYTVKLTQSVPSDGQNHQVFMDGFELPTEFRHYAAPKIDCDAFLMARVTDWDDLNLLPGQANIYFEGTYVGESWLNPVQAEDTLEFSMGRDKSVVINRKKIKDYTKTRHFGGNTVRTFATSLELRNTKDEKIMLELQELIPVSQNKEITVKLLDETGNPADVKLKPAFDEETGILTWLLPMQPQENLVLKVVYEVKYPKNSHIPNLL